ncbi:MAG: hypothetical protein KDK36_19485 [Leptospiraceae bacterium]|nr:hypothetical protein [Leptospiraceae bacterium]
MGELDVTKDFPTSIQSSCNAYLSFASQNATGNSEYYNRYRKEIDWMLVQCLAYKSRVGDCNKKSDYIPKFRLYRRERKEGLDQFFYE